MEKFCFCYRPIRSVFPLFSWNWKFNHFQVNWYTSIFLQSEQLLGFPVFFLDLKRFHKRAYFCRKNAVAGAHSFRAEPTDKECRNVNSRFLLLKWPNGPKCYQQRSAQTAHRHVRTFVSAWTLYCHSIRVFKSVRSFGAYISEFKSPLTFLCIHGVYK